jgi:type III pantothenate kinase
MRPDAVADVGNSRVKVGFCQRGPSPIPAVHSFLHDAPELSPFLDSHAATPHRWVVASVQPVRSRKLVEALRGRGQEVTILDDPARLPLKTDVTEPRRVGMDRLLNGVAARTRLAEREPAVLIDAGSAVTVDWLDEQHVFGGGTIFPGIQLMAEALHRYTALLPLVSVREADPPIPGRDTTSAMQAGVFHAVVGGIERIARRLAENATRPPRVFLTGGDAALLRTALDGSLHPTFWAEMTLAGIVFAAEALEP